MLLYSFSILFISLHRDNQPHPRSNHSNNNTNNPSPPPSSDQAASAIKSQAAQIFQQLPDDQRQWLQQGLDTLSPDQKNQLQDSIMKQLPEEQREQAKSYLQSAGDVGMGMAGTVGGGLKGVGDTLGNT